MIKFEKGKYYSHGRTLYDAEKEGDVLLRVDDVNEDFNCIKYSLVRIRDGKTIEEKKIAIFNESASHQYVKIPLSSPFTSWFTFWSNIERDLSKEQEVYHAMKQKEKEERAKRRNEEKELYENVLKNIGITVDQLKQIKQKLIWGTDCWDVPQWLVEEWGLD